ncbi:hypothetical protein A3Q56_06807 [Intoshia linei]|uniref:Uncharacterized protein n=1 Tax=Intoshia linei TaxID=1819745 RepID=A0A177AUG5_9BILA|nr:hypothetical protein A3Q56_06807 [Intoshia linei]
MIRMDDKFIRINLIQQVTAIFQTYQLQKGRSKSVHPNEYKCSRNYSSYDCITTKLEYGSKLNINDATLKFFDDGMSYNYTTIKAHPSGGKTCKLWKVTVLGANNLDKRIVVENMMNYTFINRSHNFQKMKLLLTEIMKHAFHSIIIIVELSCNHSFLFVKRLCYKLSSLYNGHVPKIIVGRDSNKNNLKFIINDCYQLAVQYNVTQYKCKYIHVCDTKQNTIDSLLVGIIYQCRISKVRNIEKIKKKFMYPIKLKIQSISYKIGDIYRIFAYSSIKRKLMNERNVKYVTN